MPDGGEKQPGADILSWCRGCRRGTLSTPCPGCGGPSCARCARCPECDGPLQKEGENDG